jgi:ferredoxin
MAQYRIEIDRENCTSCEQCVSEAPATFGVDDHELAIVIDPEGDPPDVILAAAEGCPVEAIALYDADTGAKVWPEE